VNRRHFLHRLGATAGFSLAAPLAFTSRLAAADLPPDLGRIAYQLSWIKNFQFAGEYVADTKKYYQRFGLAVDLLAGGPGTTVDPIVVSGKALVAQSSPDDMSNAVAKGAPVRAIGACYQRPNVGIASPAQAPLRTPLEMIGKRIGVQTNNLVIWRAFLKLNQIAPSSIITVPVQFDFAPLLSREVDGFFGDMNDDAVELRNQGHDVYALMFSDFGYKMFGNVYSVRADSLTDPLRRAQLVAFIKGECLGWQDVLRDPTLGIQLTIDVYGKGNGLDPKIQRACSLATNASMVSPDTQQHGLFWMSPASVNDTIHTLAAAGIKATPDLFTNEILEEAYQDKSISKS
jgi:ABC-type nitrate/sulfonate/bicarbonate transport system substrate-binding protein